MARAKTARASKPKSENKVLHMPENAGNGTELELEIRLRAYEIYEQRGYTNGRAEQDWFDAEQEVLARHGKEQHTA
jgi:DUF2934 family protein